jgi:tRNA(Arg) A34 adenosine deaminase TadA
MTGTLSEQDKSFLRHCIELSRRVRDSGKHPFAAIVVDATGQIVAEAGNDSLPPDGDPTRHAELVAAGMAAKKLSPGQLAAATLYSSAEPCAMCAGAIYWCGIGRVVYALSEHKLLGLTDDHPENPTFALPCREVFARGQRSVEIAGPYLEAEAAEPHIGFWKKP